MGFTVTAGDRDPHPGFRLEIGTELNKDLAPRQTCVGGAAHLLKLAARAQTRLFRKGETFLQIYALVNSTRPWRRRRLIILRPLAVAILARKPLTALRHRLLG